jgi:hypothetical protein
MPLDRESPIVQQLYWYYIQPGDLDWRDNADKSVYVSGNRGPFGAHHVAINAPRGIRIVAEKPEIRGPFDRPHRMLLRDGTTYKGWTNTEYFESKDAIHWEKKANLTFDTKVDDGLYQVFLDPDAPPSARFKATWNGLITRDQFNAFRAARPDGWEPRALLHLEEKNEVACLRGGVSPDGVHWKTLPDPLVVEYTDTWNTGYYDRSSHEYVFYTRLVDRPPDRPASARHSQ